MKGILFVTWFIFGVLVVLLHSRLCTIENKLINQNQLDLFEQYQIKVLPDKSFAIADKKGKTVSITKDFGDSWVDVKN